MSLTDDLDLILETVSTDPSFGRIGKTAIKRCIGDCRRYALEGSVEAFLWSAMRLLALPNNGHTRLIPNDAISVLPLRIVSVGRSFRVIGTASGVRAPQGELLAVNGAAVGQIETAAEKYLAGTPQRKRVIGSIILVWPYALAHLGFASKDGAAEYHVKDKNGQTTSVTVAHDNSVAASTLYPINEHGKADPSWAPNSFLELRNWQELGLSIRLPSFFDPSKNSLRRAVLEAANRVGTCASRTLLIDLRGNTGGDFLVTMPLIDAISQSAGQQVVALVDKFTFSAAIVFTSILKHRLGTKFKLIGEEMGDELMFFAEGGLVDLPTSGAVVRYSSAFHDWKTGTPDETTPPEIALQLVPAGELNMEREWVIEPSDEEDPSVAYRQILGRAGDWTTDR